MPPFNNQMGYGMPPGAMQGINPQWLQQLQSQQGMPQQQGPATQGSGMESMPMGAPMPPPGWQGQNGEVATAPQMPPQIYQKPMPMSGGMGGPGQISQRPMQAPPGWEGMQGRRGGGGMPTGGYGGRRPPMQADRPPASPPAPRLPPNAGVWKNPATGQNMNEVQRYSGRNNPFTQAPQMSKPMEETAPPDPTTKPMEQAPVDPVYTKPKPISGSPPFNQSGGLQAAARNDVQATPPTQGPAQSKLWQPEEQKYKQMKAQASVRKLSGASAR